MSLGLICDACGEALLADSDVRYILRIQGYAAYDPLEITREDLERNFEAEMRELLEKIQNEDPETLQGEVFKDFKLDLCPRCWREYSKDPLAGLRKSDSDGAGAAEEERDD